MTATIWTLFILFVLFFILFLYRTQELIDAQRESDKYRKALNKVAHLDAAKFAEAVSIAVDTLESA